MEPSPQSPEPLPHKSTQGVGGNACSRALGPQCSPEQGPEAEALHHQHGTHMLADILHRGFGWVRQPGPNNRRGASPNLQSYQVARPAIMAHVGALCLSHLRLRVALGGTLLAVKVPRLNNRKKDRPRGSFAANLHTFLLLHVQYRLTLFLLFNTKRMT